MDRRRSSDSEGTGDYLIGRDGRPILDRYGRPVRRRTAGPAHGVSSAQTPGPRRSVRDAGASRTSAADRDGSRHDAPGSRRYSPRRDTESERDRIERARAERARAERRQAERDRDERRRDSRRRAERSQSERARGQRAGAGYRPTEYRTRLDFPAQGAEHDAAENGPMLRPRSSQQFQQPPHGVGNVPPRTNRPSSEPEARPPRRRQRPARAVPLPRLRLPKIGCVGCLGRILAVLVVVVLVFGLWADTRLNRVPAEAESGVGNTAGTNWLLVGSDSRQGLDEADVERLGTGGDIGVGRTDTVMLLHIPTMGKATLVSLPRDSYLNVPGYGMDKLNAAFSYGGPPLLTQTVEQATGLHIDHYAEIGMGGLANTVDAAGGVTVCPEEPIADPLANLDIQAGCQKVDGPTALGYVRTRSTANGDLDRVARQREFFSALLHAMTSPATLLNPLRSVPTVLTVSKSFTVGEHDHVWHLLRVPLAMRGVRTETVPIGGFDSYDVGSVVLWDEVGAEELFAELR